MKAGKELEIENSALKIRRFSLFVGLALLMSGLCRPTQAVDWYVATNGTGLGTNYSWMTNRIATSVDLDGRQRVRYGTVDMGAYEHILAGTIYGVH